jgi:hypothetical protein
MGKAISKFVSPGQVVGAESLSSGSATTTATNYFSDHCTCITPIIAISFAAAGKSENTTSLKKDSDILHTHFQITELSSSKREQRSHKRTRRFY